MKLGPSPHAWGEQILPGFPPSGFRTIPTRVGRTTQAEVMKQLNADHPHTRGENSHSTFFG